LAGNLAVTMVPAIKAGNIATNALNTGARYVSSAAGAAEPYVAGGATLCPWIGWRRSGWGYNRGADGDDVQRGAALGGALGAALPFVAGTGNALLTSRDPAVVKAVTEHGIPLRYGQVSDNRIIRYLDDITAPESSNVAQRRAVTTDAAPLNGRNA
jgi:hypothetical protein